jgi:hypothetical protein
MVDDARMPVRAKDRNWYSKIDIAATASELIALGVNIIGHFCYPSGLRTSVEAIRDGLTQARVALSLRDRMKSMAVVLIGQSPLPRKGLFQVKNLLKDAMLTGRIATQAPIIAQSLRSMRHSITGLSVILRSGTVKPASSIHTAGTHRKD